MKPKETLLIIGAQPTIIVETVIQREVIIINEKADIFKKNIPFVIKSYNVSELIQPKTGQENRRERRKKKK